MFLVMLARSVLVLARSLTRAPSISEMFENPVKMLEIVRCRVSLAGLRGVSGLSSETHRFVLAWVTYSSV